MIFASNRLRHLTRTSSVAVAALLTMAAPAQLLQDVPTVVVPPEPPLSSTPSIFARDRVTPVADRMFSGFEAQGISVGEFDVYPALSIGGLYSSNIYADNHHKVSDVAAVVRPELTIRTSGGPYQLAIYGQGDFRRYANHSSENSEEGLGGLEGSVAIGAHSSLSAGANYGSLIEPRYAADSPINAGRPLEYTALSGFAGATIEGANTRAIFRTDISELRFSNVPSFGGGTLYTKDRDRTRYQGLLRLERALSPAFSIYTAVSGNIIDYRLVTCCGETRDSKGYGLYVGSSFEVTSLLRGDVRVGYIRQNFDLRGVRAISGLGALATLVYFPNALWTITTTAESSVQDSGVPGTTGVLHRGGSIRADYELRRYIMASVQGGYYQDTYRGQLRRDHLPFAGASLTYLSHDHWNARVGYTYLSRTCSCTAGIANFADNRVSLTLTFQK